MKTSEDVQNYLEHNKLDAELLNLSTSIQTVEEAANAIKTEKNKIIKSLVFTTDKSPLLAIINGENEVSSKKIRTEYKVKKCQLASPEMVKEITGYPIGSVPPIGLEIPTIIDDNVIQKNYVYGGGGSKHHLLKIAPGDLLLENKTLITNIKK